MTCRQPYTRQVTQDLASAMASLPAWAAAIALAAAICVLPGLLDGPSDHATQTAIEQDLQDAIKTEAQTARFTRAAGHLCGENAGWVLVDATTMQCVDKHGRKTNRVQL